MAAAGWGQAAQAGVQAVSHYLDWTQRNDAREDAERLTREQMQLQREAAQHGISWRVRDALNSGIHPIYAMGASAPSISPVISSFPDSGSDFAGMGQGISRAIDALSTSDERQSDKIQALQVERGELENAKLRAEIALMGRPNPPLPSAMPGAGVSAMPVPSGDITWAPAGPHPGYTVKPVEIPAVQPGRPTQEAGAIPGVRWERTQSGFRPQPAEALKIDEADFTDMKALEWYWHNRVIPSINMSRDRLWGRFMTPDTAWNPPPRSMLPAGATGWRWSRLSQEYQPVYD